MITIKTKKEIEIMKEGGRILASVMVQTLKEAKPDITTAELDNFAERLIRKKGARASFKMVPKYHWATCLCVNDCVVHGVPNQYRLKEGDILGIDIGVFYKGFHTDMARTLCVRTKNSKLKTKNAKVERFLKIGRQALEKAIEQARLGNRVGHISKAIQETTEAAGYSVVKTLVGHGIGRELHEAPQIPCFLKDKIEDTPLLKKGMAFAIEIIYNRGSDEIFLQKKDGWTILTKDGNLSGLFEDTILLTENSLTVLTNLA